MDMGCEANCFTDMITSGDDRATDQPEKSEEVPWMVFMGREWEQHSFEEVTILFPESRGS